MIKVLTNTIFINKNIPIEPYLKDRFGEVVRWAIVEVDDTEYKVTFSYEVHT